MTVSTIIARARDLADITGSSFFSSSEEYASLNESYRDLYEQILNAEDDYFAEEWDFLFSDLTAIDGQVFAYTLAVPADFYRLRTLQYQLNNRWPSIDKFNPINEAQIDKASYRIIGENIKLILPMMGQYTGFRALYFPVPEEYTAGTEDIVFPPQLEPAILAYQIAIDIKRKQDADYSKLQQRRDELWARFEGAITRRDDWQYQPAANVYRTTDNPWR